MIAGWVALVCLALIQGIGAQTSFSSSVSYSVPGYAPVTHTATSGNAIATATGVTAYRPVQVAPANVPYHTGRVKRATPLDDADIPKNIPEQLPVSSRSDSNQQISQKSPPPGLLELNAPSHSAPAGISQSVSQLAAGPPPGLLEMNAPSHSAPAGISQSVSQLAAGPPRTKRGYQRNAYVYAPRTPARAYGLPPAYSSSPAAPSQAYGVPTAYAPPPPARPSQAYGTPIAYAPRPPAAPAQAYGVPIAYAPPPPAAPSQAYGVPTFYAPPPPAAPSQSYASPSAFFVIPTGSTGVISQAAAAFAPPPPSVYGLPDRDTGSVVTALVQAGAEFVPQLTASKKTTGDLASALVDAGAEFIPPIAPEGLSGETAAAPPAPEDTSSTPVEDGNLGAVLSQAVGEFAPPVTEEAASSPAPEEAPVTEPAPEAGSDAASEAVSAPAPEPGAPPAPEIIVYPAPPPALPSVYGLPSNKTPRQVGEFIVVPLRSSPLKDFSKGLVFIPAQSRTTSTTRGTFQPPDGALLARPFRFANDQPVPSYRTPLYSRRS